MPLRVVIVLWAAVIAAAPGASLRAGDAGGRFAPDSVVRSSLARAFPPVDGVSAAEVYRPVVLDSATMTTIALTTKSPFPDDTLRVFECRRGEAGVGYGIVDNVRGKTREITYLVALTPAGEVSSVDILVYRESHGGEVESDVFTDQFKGKKAGDRLTPGRDIRNVSGATISSRSVAAGVARVLAAFAAVKGRL